MSNNFFANLKRVNKRSNLIVFGYLRENESKIFGELMKLNTFYNFPEILHNICLIYYHITDKWDTKYIGECHKLSQDGLSIENIRDSTFNSSYGEVIAKSPGVYHWKFKLQFVPELSYSYWAIILGVWKTKSAEVPPTNNHFSSTANRDGSFVWGYAFDAMNGTLVDAPGTNAKVGGDYGRKCKTADIVEVILNLDVFTIKFNINDEDFGIAHKNIEDTEYRVALTTYYIGPIVEMLP